MKLPKEIQRELDLLGVTDWTLENRKRHTLLRIAGRSVLTLPRGAGAKTGYAIRNSVAELRRCVLGRNVAL